MPASMIVDSGEAMAMATKEKASRAITKKELAYFLSRLCTVNSTTMRVRVSKRPSCGAICERCDAALARFIADPSGIALAV